MCVFIVVCGEQLCLGGVCVWCTHECVVHGYGCGVRGVCACTRVCVSSLWCAVSSCVLGGVCVWCTHECVVHGYGCGVRGVCACTGMCGVRMGVWCMGMGVVCVVCVA